MEILLVEDNPGDVLLTSMMLSEAKVTNRVHVAHNGEDALAFLRRDGKYQEMPQPDLILLDINMPGMSGWDVLEAIRGDVKLKRIPVLVLTSSDLDEDVLRSYDLHANCYMTKPLNIDQFARIVRSIDDFWLDLVRLPSRAESA